MGMTEQEVINAYRESTGRTPSASEISYQMNLPGATAEGIANAAEISGDTVDGRATAAAAELQTEYLNNMSASTDEANRIAQEGLEIARQGQAINQEQYDYWKENFLPMEDELIQQAESGIDPEAAASVAGNRMSTAHDNMSDALERNIASLGIDSSNPRYEAVRKAMGLQKVKDTITAKNNARLQTKDINDNMQMTVAGMSRGMPASSLSAFNQSAQSIGQSANTSLAGNRGLSNYFNTAMGVNSSNSLANTQAGLRSDQFDRQATFDTMKAEADAAQGMYDTIGTGVGLAASMYGNRSTGTGKATPIGGTYGGKATNNTGMYPATPYI